MRIINDTLVIYSVYENGNKIDKICEVINNDTNIVNIELPYCKIESSAFKKLMDFLHNNKNIQQLQITNTKIGHENVVDIANMLTNNTNIQHLEISGTLIGNVGVLEISKALAQNTCVKTLILDSNNISGKNEGMTAIMENLSKNSSITYLSLSHNMISGPYARSIADYVEKNNCLKTLMMGGNSIGDVEISQIVDSLIDSQIQLLDISGNSLFNEGVLHLSELLKQNKTLQCLHIDRNRICANAFISLCDSLCTNNTLTQLSISNIKNINNVRAMTKMLQTNSSIKTCRISDSNFEKYGIFLSECIGMSSINSLEILLCEIDTESLCNMIINNKNLTKLCLRYCVIGDVAAEKILATLTTSNRVTFFQFSNNEVTDKITDAFVNYIKDNTVLNHLEIDIGSRYTTKKYTMKIMESISSNTSLHTAVTSDYILDDQCMHEIAHMLENNYTLTKINYSRFENFKPIEDIIKRNKEFRFKRQKVAPLNI